MSSLHKSTQHRARGKSKERVMRTNLASSTNRVAEDTQAKNDVDNILVNTSLSVKDRVEEEGKKLEKAQRTHERLLKKLEEASARTATREAKFRLREREFQDTEARLLGDYEKLSKEIARARESMRSQVRKAEERLETKEQDWDNREHKKVAVYNATAKELKEKIEVAKGKLNDTAQILELEDKIRKLRDEVKEQEIATRALSQEVEDKEEELKQERDAIDRFKEKLSELDENQVKYTDVRRDKKRLEKQFEELERDLQKKQQELESKDDEEDIWSLKTQLRDIKNQCDDLVMRKDKIQTQIQRVQSGRVAVDTNTSRVIINSYDTPARSTRAEATRAESRLPAANRSSLLDKYNTGAGTTTTSTARARARDQGPTRQEQSRIDELKKSKREYEQRSGSKVQEIEKLRKQVSDATSQKEKTEQLLKKLEEDSIQYQKLIKQEKELFQAEISSLNKKIEVTKNKNETVTASHLKKLAKAKSDRQFQLSEILEQTKITADRIQEKRTEFRKLETTMKTKERNVQRGERELQNGQKTLLQFMEKLIDIENNLACTKQFVEEAQIEFENTDSDMMSEIHCLEREIYDQSETREYLEQVTAELQKEVDDLNWYFMDHKQKNPKDSRVYGTYEFDWVMHRRNATNKELEKIDDALAAISVNSKWQGKSLEDLRKAMKKIMKVKESTMSKGELKDYNARLLELIKAMMSKQYPGVVTFQIVCLLAEENAYPGMLNYLTVLTLEQDDLHVLQRPPMLLNLVYRQWKHIVATEDPDKSFRRALLERLIELRVSLQKKDPNFVTTFQARVLDGEEATNDELDSWIYDAAEYFIFFGNEGTKEDIEIEVRGLGDDDEFDEDEEFD
eukprot:TRINITY_DN4282_c0_g1_i1.p1 TRINITY_DN4282_c0_g1~~TRINITY_DN4282_c0_g1_i1.p1  ORF type:complete len:854 (-),score=258.33 TRINITY_DN4282_c0_g1_i1:37-2598(-)